MRPARAWAQTQSVRMPKRSATSSAVSSRSMVRSSRTCSSGSRYGMALRSPRSGWVFDGAPRGRQRSAAHERGRALIHAPPGEHQRALPPLGCSSGNWRRRRCRPCRRPIDVVGRMLAQKARRGAAAPEPRQDIASMVADTNTFRGAPGRSHGIRDRSGVPVTGRDRASLLRQHADQARGRSRAAGCHHRKLPQTCPSLGAFLAPAFAGAT